MPPRNRVVELLAEAERAVLESIAPKDMSSSPDYADLGFRLELARHISDIKSEAKRLYATEAVERGKQTAGKICEEISQKKYSSIVSASGGISKRIEKEIAQRTSEQFGLPAYFVEDDRLYMFGASTKGAFRMYRRVVPMRDVATIVDCIFSLIPKAPFFSISEVENRIKELPGYKVRTTVSALQECGIIGMAQPGRYEVAPEAQPNKKSWIKALCGLPNRHDLVVEYDKMHS